MQFDKLVKQILDENINSTTDPITVQDIDNIAKKTSRVAFLHQIEEACIFNLSIVSSQYLQYFDSITPITDTSSVWLEYEGNSYEQAIQVYSKIVTRWLGQEYCDDAIEQVLRLKDISRLPGTFKVINDQEYMFFFLFEIDMLRHTMGHILDAGSEGVAEEDNILDW